MKILIYGLNYSPELTGVGKYTGEMARWLSDRGHEVRVVTAPPYYPEWKIQVGYSWWRYRSELIGKVKVWRSPVWVPARPSGLTRLIHLISFAFASSPTLFRQALWRPDIVWVAAPSFFCAPLGLLAARMSGARAWLHIQDYEIDAAFELGLLRGAVIRRIVSAAERLILRCFDRVSTISDRMLTRAEEKGVVASKVYLFRNWVDISGIKPLVGPSSYRAFLAIPEQATVALYSGNMGAKQGVEILAQVARKLKNIKELYFVFCGSGAMREFLFEACKDLDRVRFLDLQPLEKLGDLLGLADIHLLPQKADAADLVMPSKLTGMLSSGRAVIATARQGTELAEVVKLAGLVVPPENVDALCAAVVELHGDGPRRCQFGVRGREYAERVLDREGVLGGFESELHKTIGPVIA